MQDAAAVQAPDRKPFLAPLVTLVRACVPTLAEASLATSSALFLILSFPNFDLWPLAWIALAPLFVIVARHTKSARAFVLGWLWGAIFFYGTCWWLTYSMIHYGHLRPWVAYLLLVLPVALVALFPALSCLALARLTVRLGPAALFAAPFVWVSMEWARYMITGEMWNAIGYSQAFHPMLIQMARWGGVYAVGFLILMANAAIAFALIRRRILKAAASIVILILITLALVTTYIKATIEPEFSSDPQNLIVAVQPNVPMDGSDNPTAMPELLDRHIELSLRGLREGRNEYTAASLVIWPESPMNFTYTADPQLQKILADFAIANHTSVLFNSLEAAPNGGSYNSAIMVNEQGRKVAQYDKIRLMPFGEYVPLPRWLPGASSVRAIVGEFTPGSSYTLMPLGDLRAGVFICFEAAHPSIARTFTNEGAEMLINISNDGYLGPTPVMRQHLANAIFRAVENDRPLRRVTNTGISANIDSVGRISDVTSGFAPTVRTWSGTRERDKTTFYTRHGDVFVYACLMIALGFVSASFFKTRYGLRPSTITRG
jgi:apolipoprotein N-acyltransferase